MNPETTRLAAWNIVQSIGDPPGGGALVISSSDKLPLAEAIFAQLEARGIEHHLLVLGSRLTLAGPKIEKLIQDAAGRWGLILLIQPQHASFLYNTVGRPDMGLKIPAEHFFCDWLASMDSLVRIFGIEMDELYRFGQALLAALTCAESIRITTKKGTDIRMTPRHWIETHGEVFTAPVEGQASGTIYVDGSAYSGPPDRPFLLRIENGRIANPEDLDQTDPQQRMVHEDACRDDPASVLAELGLGINPGALVDTEVMEAEQARGTCHFGFGHNLAYGGQNRSSCHFDLVIRHPTIEVDDRYICRSGVYQLWT